MTCMEFQGSLSAYLDRELPPPEALSMMAHAETCAHCRNERTLGLEIKCGVRDYSIPTIPADLIAVIKENTIFQPIWWKLGSIRGRWFPALLAAATVAGALWLSRVQRHAMPRGGIPVASTSALQPVSTQVSLLQTEESNQEKGERREHKKS